MAVFEVLAIVVCVLLGLQGLIWMGEQKKNKDGKD